jgi:general stress protein CsbA
MSVAAGYVQLLVPMLWVGMMLAISFLEAPLKFRAPGVTVPIGLGIGRLVFKALNGIETVLALLLLAASFAAGAGATAWMLLITAVVVLAIQVVVVRPPLTRRSDRVLSGETLPRSKMHLVYVGLEVVKVVLLVALAIGFASAVIECLP